MESILQTLAGLDQTYVRVFLASMRFAAPLLAALLLWRCLKPLVSFRREPEIWGWLQPDNWPRIPLTHWENIIGRSKSCDVVVDFPTVSRNHAVLTRYDDGSWTVTDAGSKSGTLVNGKRVQIHAMRSGDVINIGGLGMRLAPSTSRQEQWMAERRGKKLKGSGIDSVANLLLLTLFQLLVALSFLLTGREEYLHLVSGKNGRRWVSLVLKWKVSLYTATQLVQA